MINSTSSQGTPISAVIPGSIAGAQRPKAGASDSLSTGAAEFLRAKLASEPEVRPEVVARGMALAADPSYPPASVITQVARTILNSPDPSEDPS